MPPRNNSQALATIDVKKPVQSVDNFRQLMQAQRSAFEMALPSHVTPEKMYRVMLTSVNRVPKLLNCTGMSLLAAGMAACETGLLPSGILGEAAIVPFGSEAVFIPGYKGLVKLIYQTGKYESVTSAIIYKCDKWSIRMGTEPGLDHTPDHDHKDYGNMDAVVGAYATARRVGSTVSQFEYVPLQKILAIKAQSAAGKKSDSPWNHKTNYTWMYRKTAIKQLAKMLEVSSELQRAVEVDDAVELGRTPTPPPALGSAPISVTPGDNAEHTHPGSTLDARGAAENEVPPEDDLAFNYEVRINEAADAEDDELLQRIEREIEDDKALADEDTMTLLQNLNAARKKLA